MEIYMEDLLVKSKKPEHHIEYLWKTSAIL